MRSFFILGSCVVLTFAAPRAAGAASGAEDERLLKEARLPVDGPGLLALFKQRAELNSAGESRLRALVKQLGDDDFGRREQATDRLVACGTRARSILSDAENSPDIEVKRRSQDCLRRIDESAPAVAAGVRTLARHEPPGAVEVLLAYLPFADSEIVAEEVRAALAGLAVRQGKANPALVTALADPVPARRAGAAIALCRAEAPGLTPALHKLLEDPDPAVRMRVALALARRRDKSAVPVLIRLLGKLEASRRGEVETFLDRLAEEKGPAPIAAMDAAAWQKRSEAWLAWWKAAGPGLDPARLEEVAGTLNHTLVVLLEDGKIIDLDERNQPTGLQFDGLVRPLDAQLLPGDRVLVAEHDAARVTERNRKGEIVWKKELPGPKEIVGPVMAQRLANGNTFIATKPQLLEVDKNGREVFSYQPPGGEDFMKAQKVRNGDIACIMGRLGAQPRFVLLDATGKELRSFPVALHTTGGRIDVLPNGHVLVPDMHNDRVCEHDAEGRIVWELHTRQPVAAIRLPGGTTLVTSMTQNRAVEYDAAGKEVWVYQTDKKVTRAFRR